MATPGTSITGIPFPTSRSMISLCLRMLLHRPLILDLTRCRDLRFVKWSCSFGLDDHQLTLSSSKCIRAGTYFCFVVYYVLTQWHLFEEHDLYVSMSLCIQSIFPLARGHCIPVQDDWGHGDVLRLVERNHVNFARLWRISGVLEAMSCVGIWNSKWTFFSYQLCSWIFDCCGHWIISRRSEVWCYRPKSRC